MSLPQHWLLPWPAREILNVHLTPTELDLCNVLSPLLQVAESMALALTIAMDGADRESATPGELAPVARLLYEHVRLARALYLAWQERPEGISVASDAFLERVKDQQAADPDA